METFETRAYACEIVALALAKLGCMEHSLEFFQKSLDYSPFKRRQHQHLASIYFRMRLFEKSLEHSLDELSLSQTLNEAQMADSYKRVAFAYFELHYYENALPYAQKSLDLRRELNVGDSLLADACQNVAFALFNMSEFERALELSHESLSIRKRLKNSRKTRAELANSYQTVAFTHLKLGNRFSTLKYHKCAMRTRLSMGILSLELCESFENVADAFYELGQFRNAYIHRLNALDIRMRLAFTSRDDLADCLHSLVFICLKRRDYGTALTYCLKELTLREKSLRRDNDDEEKMVKLVYLYKNTAFAYFHLNELRNALGFRLKALDFERKLFVWYRRDESYLKLAVSYEHVADLYVEMDNLKMARKYFLKGERLLSLLRKRTQT